MFFWNDRKILEQNGFLCSHCDILISNNNDFIPHLDSSVCNFCFGILSGQLNMPRHDPSIIIHVHPCNDLFISSSEAHDTETRTYCLVLSGTVPKLHSTSCKIRLLHGRNSNPPQGESKVSTGFCLPNRPSCIRIFVLCCTFKAICDHNLQVLLESVASILKTFQRRSYNVNW